MLARGAVQPRSPKQKKWLTVAACHVGMLADKRTPVGLGRFRDHAKTPLGFRACLVPLPLLSVKRAVWHTLTEEHDGYEVGLLAQLRLPLETRAERIPPPSRASSS